MEVKGPVSCSEAKTVFNYLISRCDPSSLCLLRPRRCIGQNRAMEKIKTKFREASPAVYSTSIRSGFRHMCQLTVISIVFCSPQPSYVIGGNFDVMSSFLKSRPNSKFALATVSALFDFSCVSSYDSNKMTCVRLEYFATEITMSVEAEIYILCHNIKNGSRRNGQLLRICFVNFRLQRSYSILEIKLEEFCRRKMIYFRTTLTKPCREIEKKDQSLAK